MQRPDAREFLAAVLEKVEDLPEGLAAKLAALVSEELDNRPEAIRRLIEEASRD